MRKKLTSVALIMAAVCTIIVFATLETAPKAQESGSPGDPATEEGECPPDMCFSYATPTEDEGGEPEAPLAGCSCGLFYNAACHYEYVSAFECIPYWHEDGDSTTKEWESVHNYDNYWGLRKDNSGSSQLDLICPIPTDRGAGSIKYYGDVAQINGFFYHYNSSYPSSMYVYSAKANDVVYHGDDDDSSAGHRTISIRPVGNYYYIFWYAKIAIANHTTSSFHGLEICYDPD